MERNAKFLLGQAERCRRLAGQLTDQELARTLLDLGEDYVRQAGLARRCESRGAEPKPRSGRGPAETAH